MKISKSDREILDKMHGHFIHLAELQDELSSEAKQVISNSDDELCNISEYIKMGELSTAWVLNEY